MVIIKLIKVMTTPWVKFPVMLMSFILVFCFCSRRKYSALWMYQNSFGSKNIYLPQDWTRAVETSGTSSTYKFDNGKSKVIWNMITPVAIGNKQYTMPVAIVKKKILTLISKKSNQISWNQIKLKWQQRI